MVKKENLGFAFIVAGMFILMVAIWAIPLQPTIAPDVRKVVKVAPVEIKLSAKEHVLVAAYRRGWTGDQWNCLVKIIDIENPGWLENRRNPNSTASGLFQVLRSASGVMFSSYSIADQARLGVRYISHRYENPCVALTFHRSHGWY